MSQIMNTAPQNAAPILVLGATGKTGRRIVARLRDKGLPVRLASRRSDTPFDWNDPAGWDAALQGVKTAYVCYSPDLAVPGAPDHIQAFVDRAVARGVERLVLLSGRGEEEAQRCERIVRASGLEWTVVRASWFSQNFSEGEFLGMVLDGAIALPAGQVPEPFVDLEDVADVAVAALTEDGHAGQVYEVTGPRMLTFAEMAQEISQAAGRPVQFIDIPGAALTEGLAEAGVPPDVAWLLDYLFGTVLDGRNAYVCDGVERALGRPATDFREFARRVAVEGVWDQPKQPQARAG